MGCSRLVTHQPAASQGSSPHPRCRRRPGCGGRARRPACRAPRGSHARRAAAILAAGRRTTNSLPCPGPRCGPRRVPPCISTSRLTSDRPMPSPPCDALERLVDLREHVEDPRQHLRRDADAVVDDAHDHRVAVAARLSSRDAAACAACTSRRCSAGWRTPARAARGRRRARSSRAGRSIVSLCCCASISGPAGLDRLPNRPCRARLRSLLQLDLAAADAAHVEQVVDEPHHLPELAVHHVPRALEQPASSLRELAGAAGRCAAAPADCAARGPASPGTRPCADPSRSACCCFPAEPR